MNLKLARQIKGLTQRQLAKRSLVDVSTISVVETGYRDYGTVSYRDVIRLALVLGCDPLLLFPIRLEDDAPGAQPKADDPDATHHKEDRT
jgi:transcriptional regulator with XRE-family HTH domain